MVDVRNRDEFKAWLKTQPHQTVTMIAARAALRTIPYLQRAGISEGDAKDLIIPCFRAIATALSFSIWGQTTLGVGTVRDAAYAAYVTTVYANADDAAYAAYAAADAYADADTCAYAAYGAADAAADATGADADAAWDVCQRDVDAVREQSNAGLPQDLPLWHDKNIPASAQNRWTAFRGDLLALDSNWSVWTEWYDALLKGNAPFIEEIEIGDPDAGQFGRCTFPEEFYEDPPRLNAALREVIDGYRASQKILSYQPAGGPQTDSDDKTIYLKAANDTPDTDQSATDDPQTQQLFGEVLRKAQALQRACAGIGDNYGWEELEEASDRYLKTLGDSSVHASKHILLLHSQTIELASFIEEDRMRIQTPMVNQGKLPPAARRALSSLIMTAGPWVRRFPSALKQDEEIDNFLVKPALYQPSKEFLGAANEASLISNDDRALLSNLLEALQRGDGLSQKAGKSGQFGVRNIVVTGMQVLAGFYAGAIGSAVSADSIIAKRVAIVVTQQEAAILEIMQDAPDDIREATKEIIRRTKEERDPVTRPDQTIYLDRREDDTPNP